MEVSQAIPFANFGGRLIIPALIILDRHINEIPKT